MMSGDSHKTVIKGNTSKYVKLNVGGSLHYTTIGTLVKHDTMLRAMFSGRMEVLTDSEALWFHSYFLRDGTLPLPENRRELLELQQEAKYYLVQDLCSINSDDNLLKNIELLDKLSLRFHGRVMFIKDVISSNEICCWSFYGHGAKIAEVEFPEARIFEETLNVLLYEHRGKGPDAELMQRTRGARDGAQGYNSDEDVEEKLDRAMRRK
nr:hypothetical protein BaRGS_029611 [Batillaria attramentaria]